MLTENVGVLSKKASFLLLDYRHLDLFLFLLLLTLNSLDLALCLVHSQTLLPKPFDFALVLLLAHAPFLSVHLFKALVFCELSHQLLLELVFEALLFGGTLGLEPKLEVLRELEFFSDSTLAF